MNEKPKPPKMLSLSEMAHRLNFHPKTFRKYVIENQIPHIKLGRDMRFDATKVERYLETLATTAAAVPPLIMPHRVVLKQKISIKTSNSNKDFFLQELGLK
jgi:excisionase family DNA binding protein